MKFLKPCDETCVISDRFNTDRNYSFAPNREQRHEGLDFAPHGLPNETYYVFAGQDGQVVRVGWDIRGYGNYVVVRHNDRFTTWYCHLEKALVKNGQVVSAGDTLGIMGNTGNSTGKHLHFNVQDTKLGLSNYVLAKVVDPFPLIVSEIGTCLIEKPLYDVIIDHIVDTTNVYTNTKSS